MKKCLYIICVMSLIVGCGNRNKIEGLFGERLGCKIQGTNRDRGYISGLKFEITTPISPLPMFHSSEVHYYADVDDHGLITEINFEAENDNAEKLIAETDSFIQAVENKFGKFCVEDVKEDSETYIMVAGDGVMLIEGNYRNTAAYYGSGNSFNVLCVSRKRYVEMRDTRYIDKLPSSMQFEIRNAIDEADKKRENFL